MNIRKARVGEAQAIIDLHVDTVRRINSQDYTSDQIDAWLGNRKVEITEGMIRDRQYYVCVNADGDLLGVGNIKGNRLFGLYVSADHQGQGIGSALLRQMEDEAVRGGVAEIQTESTLTAEGFYKSRGYQEVEKKTLSIAKCQTLDVVVIRKKLSL